MLNRDMNMKVLTNSKIMPVIACTVLLCLFSCGNTTLPDGVYENREGGGYDMLTINEKELMHSGNVYEYEIFDDIRAKARLTLQLTLKSSGNETGEFGEVSFAYFEKKDRTLGFDGKRYFAR